MRFTITAVFSILAGATAVSGLTMEEAREMRPRLNEYFNSLSNRDLEKRNFCTDHFKTCQNCFDRYSFCFQNNISSSINCLATCSSCPGKC
ncbi:hypothetical protein LZ32DRAFT_663752 [Colletotrichum eremochloae]|nr:hypothetical protein LZ32DRAFT_663752 [Colletotrichum eremochloae]